MGAVILPEGKGPPVVVVAEPPVWAPIFPTTIAITFVWFPYTWSLINKLKFISNYY